MLPVRGKRFPGWRPGKECDMEYLECRTTDMGVGGLGGHESCYASRA